MLKRVLAVIFASVLLFSLSAVPSLAASPEVRSESETAENSNDIAPPVPNKSISDENMILWIVIAVAAVLVIIIVAVLVTKKIN